MDLVILINFFKFIWRFKQDS